MPYIEQDDRDELEDLVIVIHDTPIVTSGELNYLITQLCLNYVRNDNRYEYYNEVIGALECAKQEFYRRLVTPYEDQKARSNGEVYPKNVE